MPTPTKGARLGGSPSHQRLILANLATALFEHGRITTTEAKARRLRPYAEQLITKAKTDTVANRRQVVKVVRDKSVLHTLFTEIGPAMASRPGGYTRITKIGPRKGDNAPMAVIEIVEEKSFTAQATAPATSSAAPVEEPTAEETPAVNAADDSAEVETDVVAGAPPRPRSRQLPRPSRVRPTRTPRRPDPRSRHEGPHRTCGGGPRAYVRGTGRDSRYWSGERSAADRVGPGVSLGGARRLHRGVVVVRSGVVMLATGAVLAALLPATAVAASTTPTSPAPVAAAALAEAQAPSAEPEAVGIIVQSTASQEKVEAAVADALPSDVEVRDTVDGAAGLSLVELDGALEGDTASAVADAIEQRGDVAFATPNYRVQAFSTPPVSTDDPYFVDQHNLWDRSRSRGGYSVRAPSFWQTTRGSSDTVVAVLDTGIVANHADLAGQLVPGYDLVTDEYVCPTGAQTCHTRGTFTNADDGDALDPDPSDPGDWMDASWARKCGAPKGTSYASSWHGTHVAGIVAARADNGRGTAGVAPGVRVQPVRVLGHCGGDTWGIMHGIYWAAGADLGTVEDKEFAGTPVNPTPAKVLNMSLGSTMRTDAQRRQACKAYAKPLAFARSRGATTSAPTSRSRRRAPAWSRSARPAAPGTGRTTPRPAPPSTSRHLVATRSWTRRATRATDEATAASGPA